MFYENHSESGEAHRKEPEVHKNHMVTSEILTRYYYLAILYPSLGEALHLVIKGGNDHGLDDSDHR